ncbi:MAG: hypothetical protein C4534_03740 [Gaiellales bacterium]|nr:MAG: hypothetical protein C4534_03740 [Gaiellales bacterium]
MTPHKPLKQLRRRGFSRGAGLAVRYRRNPVFKRVTAVFSGGGMLKYGVGVYTEGEKCKAPVVDFIAGMGYNNDSIKESPQIT